MTELKRLRARDGGGIECYTYEDLRLYRFLDDDTWTVADDGGWYPFISDSAESAILATKEYNS